MTKQTYKHREVTSTSFLGEKVSFVAGNPRLRERAENLSHERHVLDALAVAAKPDDVVWDVGACLGVHTFVLSKHVPNGEVVGFEPMPTNRGVLMDNMSVNEITNAHIRREALSNESGSRDFAIRQSRNAGYGRHSFATGDYDKLDTITVQTIPGDTIAAAEPEVPPPNVVKIDAEGAGPLVLEGMEELLDRDACHTVVYETHEPNDTQPSYEDYGYTRSDIIQFLEDRGFTVETLGRDYHLLATKPNDSTEGESTTEPSPELAVVQGDIAKQSADALVNSAGTSLRMGTGVAGALREVGGEELNDEAIRNGPVEPGDAVVTDAYELDADIVIHAASMPHYGQGRATLDTVCEAVRNALREADVRGCSTVAVPAVGCGLGGVSLTTGSEAIASVIQSFDSDNLDEVRFVAYSDEEYEVISRVA